MLKVKSKSYKFDKELIGLVLLGLGVLGSAIGVVYIKHVNRSLHTELQQLQELQGKLYVEWTQLLLEEGAYASDARVEQIAKDELGMIILTENQKVVIRP